LMKKRSAEFIGTVAGHDFPVNNPRPFKPNYSPRLECVEEACKLFRCTPEALKQCRIRVHTKTTDFDAPPFQNIHRKFDESITWTCHPLVPNQNLIITGYSLITHQNVLIATKPDHMVTDQEIVISFVLEIPNVIHR
jgi:hypothetical protein